jgi:hypothetical protein
LDESIDQLRAKAQALHIRFIAAWAIGAASFLVFLLPHNSFFKAAKIAALGVFLLCWVYGLVVWLMAFSTRRAIKAARRAPN